MRQRKSNSLNCGSWLRVVTRTRRCNQGLLLTFGTPFSYITLILRQRKPAEPVLDFNVMVNGDIFEGSLGVVDSCRAADDCFQQANGLNARSKQMAPMNDVQR